MAHTTCKKKLCKMLKKLFQHQLIQLQIFTSATEVSDVTGLLDIQEVHLSFQRHSPVASIEFLGWA